jgi:hypothetical protein
MKNLISKLLFTVIILSSQTVFSRDINSKDSIEKINRIKYSVDSLIRSELGNMELSEIFNPQCQDYAIRFIKKEEYSKFTGVHFRFINSIPNDNISIYDLPLSIIIEDIKDSISGSKVKEWEFKKYSIIFGDFEGKSYICLSMDY